jgi:hypothetical protein
MKTSRLPRVWESYFNQSLRFKNLTRLETPRNSDWVSAMRSANAKCYGDTRVV